MTPKQATFSDGCRWGWWIRGPSGPLNGSPFTPSVMINLSVIRFQHVLRPYGRDRDWSHESSTIGQARCCLAVFHSCPDSGHTVSRSGPVRGHRSGPLPGAGTVAAASHAVISAAQPLLLPNYLMARASAPLLDCHQPDVPFS